jgi:hypothetical protein
MSLKTAQYRGNAALRHQLIVSQRSGLSARHDSSEGSGTQIPDAVVRVLLPPQPASPVSVGHVRATKIGATFPRVNETPSSLCPLWGAPRIHGELLKLGVTYEGRSKTARYREVSQIDLVSVCGIWQWRRHSCLLSFFGVSFLMCALLSVRTAMRPP